MYIAIEKSQVLGNFGKWIVKIILEKNNIACDVSIYD